MSAYDDYADALAAGEAKIGQRARAAKALDDAYKANADRLNAPGAMRAAALWYAKRGVPVFPLAVGSKQPLKDSAGFKDATTDPEWVGALWAVDDYNIGAATGVLFDVVDVDGPEGVASLMFGKSQWRDGLIGHALTPRPHGHHLFYRPSGKGNAAAVVPGVDLRGAGGYVLLSPSFYNGKPDGKPYAGRYRWLKPLELS